MWSQKADFGGGARHAAVAFSIGNKGYVGTGVSLNGPVYFNDFYEYDPNSNSWIQVSSFPASARHSAVGFAIGDKGYVGTGYDGTWKIDFWQYSPANDSWIQRADFAGMARYEAASFTIGTKGYIGLGQTSGTGLVDFWEYDTVNNLWTPIADFTGGARWSTFSFSIGNKGYVGTGVNFPAHFNDFWSYSPISNAWTQETSFGLERWDATAFSIAGKGYALTGVNNSGNQKDCWEYSPSCNVDPNPFPQDTITACGASFLLDAGSGYDSYLWNTGSTSQSITIGQSGWYICSVNQGSCSVMDSMYLDLHNVEILNNDTSICSGSSVMLTAIATGLGTGSACQLSELPSSLRQGLLAWYPFCGNATDQSGNGNDGTVYGASLTSDRFGQPGNAYSFNGSNNYIEGLNSANWQFADSKQSISFGFIYLSFPTRLGMTWLSLVKPIKIYLLTLLEIQIQGLK
ncbi:MAG: hypothetical protein IPJ66_10800 [Bacteroidetes bacterium]|nr:hypothetical protein [Bacteroidota bacterium]